MNKYALMWMTAALVMTVVLIGYIVVQIRMVKDIIDYCF